jgi:hypothetical protein
MSKSVTFDFRGKYEPADIANIQTKVEAAVRALGLTEASGVEARLERLGRVSLEVTNVPPELEETVRTKVSELLIESHGAVFSET